MTYLLDKQREEARKRLDLLARIQDPGTLACLERTGVGPGWRCLEVGAGSGTVAVWLRDRVAPGGSVVASDLDTTLLDPLAGPALEVRRHDVVADALDEEAFDLVHARNLLVHLPEREAVVEKLARAVKPGGWMLLEEIDRVTDAADPTVPEAMRSLYGKVVGEIYAFVESKGLDPTFGFRLFGVLRRAASRISRPRAGLECSEVIPVSRSLPTCRRSWS
jgi:ubiquinone/menaquinone biosynthesis C-methylase UbiE